MPRESLHIRHDQRPRLRPGGATNATTLPYPRTGHRPLKRPNHQLPVPHKIKPHPKPAKLLLQGRGHIGQIGHPIALSRHQGGYLR